MRVIGLMSGTSADAIDAIVCEITGQPPHLETKIIGGLTYPFPNQFQANIIEAFRPEKGNASKLCALNAMLGELFAEAALEIISQCGYLPEEIDLIGSHGQTFWHAIGSDGRAEATLQLGEASLIAERTGITTISNFRPRDIAVGGQGAPLTSYIDWLLLRHPSHWRAVQNIGGIGNVTFLPPLADTVSQPIAFDTGPGNALIDSAIDVLSKGRLAYDTNGQMAASGQVDKAWLSELMMHPYLAQKPPKTTGRELFSPAMAEKAVAQARTRGLTDSDIMATLTAFTAATISDAYKRFAPAPISEMIIGGGGRRNLALRTWLETMLPNVAIKNHEDIGLDSDNKEALVFAVLAHETWHARPGNLPSLTGAAKPVVLGQITPGNNYLPLLRKLLVDPA
jgi:anhydro-N-acetylmuramic acid kinase